MPSAYPESDLMQPLIHWLRTRRYLREDSTVIHEFPWQGRLIDLAVLTRSGSTSAFELKLFHTRRALHQSALNGVAFDRSSIVLAANPTEPNLAQARQLGLGVIVVNPETGEVRQVVIPRLLPIHPATRKRLRSVLKERVGGSSCVY